MSTFWPFTVWGFPKPIFKPYEYCPSRTRCCNSTYRLRYWNPLSASPLSNLTVLQQHLPFTVLKLISEANVCELSVYSCNSTYRLRYWNPINLNYALPHQEQRCNSTYRLRYWNQNTRKLFLANFLQLQQHLPFTVLKHDFSVIRRCSFLNRCNSTYRLRYWNNTGCTPVTDVEVKSCNSTYRLRFLNDRRIRMF